MQIAIPLFDRLTALDAVGLVHRDVKPANVLISAGAPLHVYLTDFGLTKRTSSQSGITKTGLFVGTIDYAAPEQIKGWPVDARADVYALGCMLFEMIAGRPPFRRENEYATMYAHVSEPPPALSSVAPGVPPALDAAVARALAKEPDSRQPSAGDFARAVSAAVAGQTPSAPERTVAVGRAAPAPPPTEPQGHPVYGYGIDPVTSVLPEAPAPARPWLPWALIAAVVVVAGVIVALSLGGGGRAASVGSQPGTTSPPVRQAGGPTVRAGVAQIGAVLDLSQEGRTLTASGDYRGAISNRTTVLGKINGLRLAPELQRSRLLLRFAVRASLRADQALLQCTTCAITLAANKRATRLKQRFVIEFNPFATRYLQRSFDSNSL